MHLDDTTIANFWQRVIRGENEDDCWGWIGRVGADGLAYLSVNGTGCSSPASRISWILHYSEVPHGARIMRRCNNKTCSNPAHLEAVCTETAAARIWSRINVIDDENSCWDWTDTLTAAGYGKFTIDQKYVLPHRFVYEQENGPIPEGMFIMHMCDRPSCCRPSHLMLGTPRDNIDDMLRKGRQLSGERNPAAVLNWEQVREIRSRLLCGEKQLHLAWEYKVDASTIYAIATNRTWRE